MASDSLCARPNMEFNKVDTDPDHMYSLVVCTS